MIAIAHAFCHWVRVGFYTVALEHVGHAHPAAAELTLAAIESQRVVDEFLAAREVA